MNMTPMALRTLMCALAAAPAAGADLLITEVVDGTLTGGQPKWIELTNTGSSSVILGGFSLGVMNNGSVTMANPAHVLTGALAPGASHVVALEPDNGPGSSQFFAVYGQDPSEHSSAQINGDDTVLLYLGAASGDGSGATLVDSYGAIGVDGTGTSWEYTDSYAARCGAVANGGIFNPLDWNIPGPGALLTGCAGDDTCEAGNLLSMTTPWSHPGCSPGGLGSTYCTGDQGSCPCTNDNDGSSGPAGCANTNFTGGASLTAHGSTSLAAADMTLQCTTSAALRPGIFFQGDNAIQGGVGSSFGAGLRCAGGAAIRLEVVSSDAMGYSSTSVNIAGRSGATPGDIRRYQLWYADPDPSALCGGGFNLSNGVELTWGA